MLKSVKKAKNLLLKLKNKGRFLRLQTQEPSLCHSIQIMDLLFYRYEFDQLRLQVMEQQICVFNFWKAFSFGN